MEKISVKKILIAVAVLISVGFGISLIMDYLSADPQIVGLQAKFVGQVSSGEPLRREMFQVKGITSDSRLVPIKNFTAPEIKKASDNGAICDVVLESQGYKTVVSVPITRKEKAALNIGYPYEEDVVVTFYENGDLEFTGKGDIQAFGKSMPWASYAYSHVYIDETISVTNMDGWFANNENLVYCTAIPKTVVSMKDTFAKCEALEEAPAYFQCKDLKIMDQTFMGCSSLKTIDVIPVNVASARYAFADCISLENGCDMSKTSFLTDITGIHQNNVRLRNAVEIPDTILYMNDAFLGCINIREATEFPRGIQSISGCYSGCTQLQKGASIPESAVDIKQCYFGCSSLSGEIEINTDTTDYYGVLEDAATIGEMIISGTSSNLLAIQKNAGTMSNIRIKDRYVEVSDKQNDTNT